MRCEAIAGRTELVATQSETMGAVTELRTDIARLQSAVDGVAGVVGSLVNALVKDHKEGGSK